MIDEKAHENEEMAVQGCYPCTAILFSAYCRLLEQIMGKRMPSNLEAYFRQVLKKKTLKSPVVLDLSKHALRFDHPPSLHRIAFLASELLLGLLCLFPISNPAVEKYYRKTLDKLANYIKLKTK